MNIIQVNGYAFRIPELASRYRANCSKEWGQFIGGETKNMTSIEATQRGLTKGNFVEMALCWVDEKILTFEPNYINEPFTEIWGIPVAGGLKDQFHEKASELSTFLMHRQSKDKLSSLIEIFAKEAFNQWVVDGMPGDPAEYAIAKAGESYFDRIFRFELKRTESSKYGAYFYVETSYRQPSGELETAALEAARQIYQAQLNGLGYCTDRRLVQNQSKSLGLAAASEPEVAALPAAAEKVANKRGK